MDYTQPVVEGRCVENIHPKTAASGQTRRGEVAYEVPKGRSPLYRVFEFSLATDGSKTFWQVR